jgi:anti-sigma factor RsiW
MSEPIDINFDSLKPEEFEQYLPELFATGDGKVSQDPRLQKFLARNPDCAALVATWRRSPKQRAASSSR